MEVIFIVLSIVTLFSWLGIGALCYAIYLLIRKRPSGFKMLLLKEEDVLPYTKIEASIFGLWGITIISLSIFAFFVNNRMLLSVGMIIVGAINIFGYFLRIRNDKKYLMK